GLDEQVAVQVVADAGAAVVVDLEQRLLLGELGHGSTSLTATAPSLSSTYSCNSGRWRSVTHCSPRPAGHSLSNAQNVQFSWVGPTDGCHFSSPGRAGNSPPSIPSAMVRRTPRNRASATLSIGPPTIS